MEKEEMLKEIERLEKEKEKNNGYLEKFDAFKLKVYKDIVYGKKTNENLKNHHRTQTDNRRNAHRAGTFGRT